MTKMKIAKAKPAATPRKGAVAKQAAPASNSVGPAADAKPKAEPKGKIATLIALLEQADGTTIEAMMSATGWQAHSVRGAISGSIKKAMGREVTSSKTETGRVYRIVAREA
jgi:hypothetical protein